jgi:hypothetical protein
MQGIVRSRWIFLHPFIRIWLLAGLVIVSEVLFILPAQQVVNPSLTITPICFSCGYDFPGGATGPLTTKQTECIVETVTKEIDAVLILWNSAYSQSAVGHFLLALAIFFSAEGEKSHIVNTASHCAFLIVLIGGIVELSVTGSKFPTQDLDGCDTDVSEIMDTLYEFLTVRNGAVLGSRIFVACAAGLCFWMQLLARTNRAWKKDEDSESGTGGVAMVDTDTAAASTGT